MSDELDIEIEEIDEVDYSNFSQYSTEPSVVEELEEGGADGEYEETVEADYEGDAGSAVDHEAQLEVEGQPDLDSTAVPAHVIALEPSAYSPASLNGHASTVPATASETAEDEIEAIEDTEGLETEEVADPRRNKTKVKPQAHPLSKAVLVGGVGLVAALALGMFYTQLNASKPDTPTVALVEEQVEPTPTETVDAETAQLKSELAFAEQTEANAMYARPTQPTPAPAAVPTASPSVTPPIRPAAVSSVPLPPVPPMITSMPTTATARINAPTEVFQQPLSPVEQWQQAAQMGSFGRTTGLTSANSAPLPVPATAPVMPTVMPTTTTPGAALPTAATSSSTSRPSISQLRNQTSVPGLRDRPMASVLVGTQTAGQLTTAVVLSSDGTTPANPNDASSTKYLIVLSQDLIDTNGAVAIPSGAQLIAVVTNFSPQAGTVQLEARGVIVDNREYTVPPGTLLLRDQDGGILTADRRGRGNSIARSILPAVFAGLGEAGRTLAQPASSTTTNGGVTTTSSSGGRNPSASFISGAFGSLGQQIQQATQAANQSASSRPNVWELEAGESVQVFVNSTFEM